MRIDIHKIGEISIAEIISENIEISNTQDALDLLANCSYQDSIGIIIYKKNIVKEFFDLKSKLAGEILQKFSNYRIKMAIVGDFKNYSSKSLKDFIYESNKIGRINFVDSIEDALEKLAGK